MGRVRPARPELPVTGVELIAVAGGGGGGGDGDGAGPGGTGGAAGHPGNPGGENQQLAGGGGSAGTATAAGAGGAGAFWRTIYGPLPDFLERQPSGGSGSALLDGLSPDREGELPAAGVGAFGGMGSFMYTAQLAVNGGGGGGGGYYGGGGGAASGADFILSLAGNGAGGGGGGGSFPEGAEITYDSTDATMIITPFYDSTLALVASTDPAVAGSPLTLSALLATTAPGTVLGGGSVSFADNGDPSDPGRTTTSLGYATVVGEGASESLVLSVPGGLNRGIHELSAYYGGYEGPSPEDQTVLVHSAAVRSTLLLAVQGPQTITFAGTTEPQTAFGATYTPQATSTFGLPVSFTIAPESSAVCSISSGIVSFLAGGTCAVLADQPGDAITMAAPQVRRELAVIGSTAQQITFTSTPPADLVFGDTYAPTATGGGSGNPVVFASPDCDMSGGALQVRTGRTCVIEANQAGGNGYAPAAAVRQTVVIPPTASRTVFTSTPPASPRVGDSYTVQAYAEYAIYGRCSRWMPPAPAASSARRTA